MKTRLTFMSTYIFYQILLKPISVTAYGNQIRFKPNQEVCVSQLKLNKTIISTINKQDIYPENNAEFNDFINCYWMRMHWLNDKAEINYTNLKVAMQDEIVQEVDTDNPAAISMLKQMIVGSIEECERYPPLFDAKADNPGKIAVKVQNCIVKTFHEVMKEHVFLFTSLL